MREGDVSRRPAVSCHLIERADPGTLRPMEGARDPFKRPISPEAVATQTAELEQAVDADERTLGAKHPDTLTARAALARGYLFSGRSAEAVTLLETNVPACEGVLGLDHADTLQSRNDLAVSYRSTGRSADAAALHEQNLSIQERLQGSDHPATLVTRSNLASALWAAGRTGEALAGYQRAPGDQESGLGPGARGNEHN